MALAVVMQRESQTVPTCMPPQDLQMLLDSPNRALARQAAIKKGFAGVCKSVSKPTDDFSHLPDVICLLD